MIPYVISNRKNNVIECNADFIVMHHNNVIVMSLIDIAGKVKKIFADMIQGNSTVEISDRENPMFKEYVSTYNTQFNYKLSKHNETMTHGVILNTNKDNYIFDWEGKGLVKSFTSYLRNKHYLPVTEEIVEKVITVAEEKELMGNYGLVDECNIYTNKNDMKHVKVWYMHSVQLFKELLESVDLNSNKNNKENFDWDNIRDISDYLTTFTDSIKNKLKENINILYDSGKINKKIHDKRKLYDGQIPIVQGGLEALKRKDNRFVYIAGEPGVGKTTIGTKINHLYHLDKNKTYYCSLVIAPTITLTQWKKEIKENIKENVDVIIIKNTNQFIRLYRETKFRFNKPTYLLVGKETFKLSYKVKHGVNVVKRVVQVEKENKYWTETVDEQMEVCTCPDCGTPLTNPLRKSKTVYFTEKDFKTPKKSNYKCSECDSVLWQATYIKNSKTSVIDFIKRRNIKFDSLILDEAHESNNFDSIIGQATRVILQHAKKSILLSGTITNGYASSIYNILYALIPNTLKKDNVFEKDSFIKTYGTLMAVTKNNDNEYYLTSRTQLKDSDYQEVEGINPLVFTKYFSNNFIFAELSDIRKDIPDLIEHYIPVNQLDEVKMAEQTLHDDIKRVSPYSASFYNESVIKHYANKPYNWNKIKFEYKNSDKPTEYVEPKNFEIENILLPKDKELIKICKERISKGEKVWVYNDFITNGKYTDGEPVEDRIKRVLENEGLKVYVLKSFVKTIERKELIDKIYKDYDVFISNAKITGTGINLQWCTNYVFYSPTYHVNIVRQAMRRGLRANSVKDNNIYHLYFDTGVEKEIMERYKLKKVESDAVQAKFSDIGVDVQRTASSLGAKIEKELSYNAI